MAKTETNVPQLKINRGTYANVQANLPSIGEDELILLTDKSLPIPADPVGAADSVDKDKVVKVSPAGGFVLGVDNDTASGFTEETWTFTLSDGTTVTKTVLVKTPV